MRDMGATRRRCRSDSFPASGDRAISWVMDANCLLVFAVKWAVIEGMYMIVHVAVEYPCFTATVTSPSLRVLVALCSLRLAFVSCASPPVAVPMLEYLQKCCVVATSILCNK